CARGLGIYLPFFTYW
nr:immunoglobulin heavy chain junction region [Macaca mulatta]MOV39111.1 immunoglobulin heavy chain junction region [Macaca mulatta]MOV41327.1 immunoglobulin heavy chain junction region [Macaca mulatta]MOV43669.1 immunoglobulin heavy chain junction region [Macaca mulatta]